MSVSIDDIEAAARTIAGHVVATPTVESAALSDAAGTDLRLKLENLQHTGSFQARGALNKLSALSPASTPGIVACSAGNHAQGVAFFAARLGFSATIVMPRGTPFTKVERTEALGAAVILEGDTLAETEAFTLGLADREGLVFVHPYDDPLIIAGQGTIGLEMLDAAPDLDAVVVPIGGGGLIAGIATAMKARRPDRHIRRRGRPVSVHVGHVARTRPVFRRHHAGGRHRCQESRTDHPTDHRRACRRDHPAR